MLGVGVCQSGYRELDVEESVAVEVVEVEGPVPEGALFPHVMCELDVGVDFCGCPVVDFDEFAFNGWEHAGGVSEAEVVGFMACGADGHDFVEFLDEGFVVEGPFFVGFEGAFSGADFATPAGGGVDVFTDAVPLFGRDVGAYILFPRGDWEHIWDEGLSVEVGVVHGWEPFEEVGEVGIGGCVEAEGVGVFGAGFEGFCFVPPGYAEGEGKGGGEGACGVVEGVGDMDGVGGVGGGEGGAGGFVGG